MKKSAESTKLTNSLISVVITTYNRCHLLKVAVNSVLMQTYKNIELIIVDDESNDDTRSYLKDLEEQYENDSEIKVKVIYTSHLGLGYSRKPGLEKVTGRYLLLMDSDDYILDKNYFETAVKIMQENKNVNAYVCQREFVNEAEPKKELSEPKLAEQNMTGLVKNSIFKDELGSEFRPNWIQIIVDLTRTSELNAFLECEFQEFPMYLMSVFANQNACSYITNQKQVAYRIHSANFSKNIETSLIVKSNKMTVEFAKRFRVFSEGEFLVNRTKRMFEYYIMNSKNSITLHYCI